MELPLRDSAAVDLVRRLLAETGPALLLALPALAEVVIEILVARLARQTRPVRASKPRAGRWLIT